MSAHAAQRRTTADLRLEKAAVQAETPAETALRLSLAKTKLQNARSACALAALELARAVDIAAAVRGEAWTLESLGLTEPELMELMRATTPNLMELGDPFAPPAATEPRR